MSTAAAWPMAAERDALAGKSSSSKTGFSPFWDILAGEGSEPAFSPWGISEEQCNQATDVTPIETHSDWLPKAFRRLVKLSSLTDNWDSYGAEPPTMGSIQLARQLFRSLSNNDLEPSTIDPSAEGGVCISFREGSRYADFECFNTGELLAVTSRGGDETDVWAVRDVNQDLDVAIDELREFLGR